MKKTILLLMLAFSAIANDIQVFTSNTISQDIIAINKDDRSKK